MFSETQFDLSGDIEIVEISQSTFFTATPRMRMIGIRDCEEVLCWEVWGTCHGRKSLKSYNQIDRVAFRFPFYAYAMSDEEIVVNYLSQENVGIYFKMDFVDELSYIHNMCFSNSCDLFVVAHERNNTVVIYRMAVGRDLSIENK